MTAGLASKLPVVVALALAWWRKPISVCSADMGAARSKSRVCSQLRISSGAPHVDGDPRFGIYNLLTDGTVGHSGTPVYQSATGSGFHVYRTSDKWIVGTQLHSLSEAGLFVMDNAPRPEKVGGVWFAMFTTGWSADPTLKVSCTSEQGKEKAVPVASAAITDAGKEPCRDQERLEEAEACLRGAIAKTKNFGTRLSLDLRLANVLYRRNDPGDPEHNLPRMEEAANLYRKGIAIMPKFADARQHYGALLALCNRLHESEDTLREALKLDPLHSSAHEDLGRVVQWQGRMAEAQAVRQRAVQIGVFPAVDFRPGTFDKSLPVEPFWTRVHFSTSRVQPRYKSYPCLERFVNLLRDSALAMRSEFVAWRADAPSDYTLDKFGFADPEIRGGTWQEWYVWPHDPFLSDFHSASHFPKETSTKKWATSSTGSDCNPRTPKTCSVLRDLGVRDWDPSGKATMYEAMVNPLSVNIMNARFSVVGPKGHVRPHVGPSNFKLALHLPIIVPPDETGGHGSYVRVKDLKQPFIEGEPIIFEDTFEHEVWNYANESRVTMWIFFSKPELTACGGAKLQDESEL